MQTVKSTNNSTVGLFSNPGKPDEQFYSQYGFVTYRQWCEHEFERMHGALKLVEFWDGNIALVKTN